MWSLNGEITDHSLCVSSRWNTLSVVKQAHKPLKSFKRFLFKATQKDKRKENGTNNVIKQYLDTEKQAWHDIWNINFVAEYILDEAKVQLHVSYIKGVPVPEEIKVSPFLILSFSSKWLFLSYKTVKKVCL